MRAIATLIPRPGEEPSDEGALQTALSEFAKRLPIAHLSFDGADLVRQVLCLGGRAIHRASPAPCSLAITDRSELYIESRTRRVHAFWYHGSPVWIDQAVLEDVLKVAEASIEAQPRPLEKLEIYYADGVGCWTGRARRAARTPIGCFVLDPQRVLFDPRVWREVLQEFLVVPFTDAYPQFRHDGDFAAEQLIPTALDEIDSFLDRLQPAASQACRDLDWLTLRGFNFFASEDARIAVYRHQAIRAIPILGVLLVWRTNEDVAWVTAAVDHRQPLLDAAARAFHVPRETIRFLVGKSLDDLGLEEDDGELTQLWIRHAPLLMSSVAAMAPEQRPRTACEWSILYSLVQALLGCSPLLMPVVRQFFARVGSQGLVATRDRLIRRYGSLSAISDCSHFLRSLIRSVGHRAAIRFVEHVGVHGLLEESKRWHAALARQTTHRLALIEGADGIITAPYVFPDDFEGFKIRFLDRYSALVEEGTKMQHCVATLYRDCATGKRLVFSLRASGGSRLATFDVSILKGGGELNVVVNEMRGYGNTDVTAESRAAVAKFLGWLTNELRTRPDAATKWMKQLQSKRVGKIDKRAANLVDEVGREAALAVFRRVRES